MLKCLWLLPLVVLLVIAGCGGRHKTWSDAATPVKDAHPCKSADYFAQCAKVPPPHPRLAFSAPVAQGVDFAWGGPSCATLRAQGRTFGASYLSFDFSKNWSHGQFAEYVAHGCGVVFVWETGATEATNGFGSGASDARSALGQYRSYIPLGRVVIYFAIDCDCSGGQVDSYFRGVDSVLGAGQAGAYGGIRPLNYLFSTHLIDWGWQTYAWSGGAWNRSQLEQYLNDNSVDYDRAISKDYGQYPAPVAPPPPPPPFNPHYELYPDSATPSTLGVLHERGTVERYDQLRKAAHPNAGELRWLERRLGALMWTVYHRAHDSKPPAWSSYNRVFRFRGLKVRYEGRRIGS